MNREILFRGKRIDNGEWFEGSYWLSRSAVRETTHITDGYGNLFCVIPETVGQFTGLTDKNGVKIFEGDIVTVENPNISDDEYGIVKFDDDSAMFIVEFDTFTVDFGNNIDGNQCEIIGNIFDNSEFLKGEDENEKIKTVYVLRW